MVAIVTGAGLGLERGSGFVLGSRGTLGDATFGRWGDRVTVNAATGNLVISRTDEILIGRGPDNVLTRTYNSLGQMTDDNGDNWQLSAQRRVTGLTGALNAVGSTITRYDWDGSSALYLWDVSANAYVSKEGSGAYDRLTFNANVWTWTDGATQLAETYDALSNGRITATADTDGNSLTYAYNAAGQLSQVSTASGEWTRLDWSGNNLTQLVTGKTGGATLTRTLYGYDSYNRLSTVTTDLSPDDNSVTDGNVVITSYGYDGTSRRVGRITQATPARGNGVELNIAYVQVGSDYRVASYTQVTNGVETSTTTLSYDVAAGTTTVTDAKGQATTLSYDANGQLKQVDLPPAYTGATPQMIVYTYNAGGDVISVKDGGGKVTTYDYDTNGNLVLERDAAGNTITRSYGTRNELLTETRYAVADPDGAGSAGPAEPATVRYVYDAELHLRFVVSAGAKVGNYQYGNITEYRYNAAGQRIAELVYRDDGYNITGFAPNQALSESAMQSKVDAIVDKSNVERTDWAWDFRGNLSTEKRYFGATAAGEGADGYSMTTYIYDQYGNLLSRKTNGLTNAEVFVYDGLGRIVSSTDLNGATTTILFDDGYNKVVTTLATGLVRTASYSRAGQLIRTDEAGTGYVGSTVTYQYDSLGRLRIMTDPTLDKTYYLYDAVGRKVADIAADGAIVEYGYDAANRLVRTIRYATRLSTAKLASLVDANGNPADVDLASVRPAADWAADQWEGRVYDAADRLIEVIDNKGAATIFAYDGRSNLVKTTSYAGLIGATTLAADKAGLVPIFRQPTSNPAKDIVTRVFYDEDGQQIGALDGAGYLTRTLYNKAGEKIETVAFAKRVDDATLRDSGTFDQLLTAVGTDNRDIHRRFAYDGRGQLRYELDANLRPTEYQYDGTGKLVNRIDYGDKITRNSTGPYSLTYIKGEITALNLNTNPNTRRNQLVYDGAGQVAYQLDSAGGVIAFDYDAFGRMVKKTAFATVKPIGGTQPTLEQINDWAAANDENPEDRITRTVYDLGGRIAYEVDGEGYVTEYRYDKENRVTSKLRYALAFTVNDNVTKDSLATAIGNSGSASRSEAFGYDPIGRLATSTDGVGSITRYSYDALNRVIDRTVADGTDDAATIHYSYDAVGRIETVTTAYGKPEASTTSYTYDGLGNKLTETDGTGLVTTYSYDNVGQLLSASTPTPAGLAVTNFAYDAFGNLISRQDPLGNFAYYSYDLLDRLIWEVDTEGYATSTAYTIGGEVESVTRYARKTTAAGAGTVPSVTADAARDWTISYDRDKVGRVVRMVDALGNITTYTNNAFGEVRTKVAAFNAVPLQTVYLYDRRGLLTRQTVDSVTVGSTTTGLQLATKYAYNGFGEVESVTDPLNKVTQSQYDNAGRRTKTIDALTNPTTYTYDRRNNLVAVTESLGKVTRYVYDKSDRRIATIDALGGVVTTRYDAEGRVLATTAYGNRISLVGLPLNVTALTLPAISATDQVTRYAYNQDGTLRFKVDALMHLTEYSTDKMGNVLRIADYDGEVAVDTNSDANARYNLAYLQAQATVLRTLPNARVTRQVYDALGQLTFSIDALNYVTAFGYDGNGQVTKTVAYGATFAGTSGNPTDDDMIAWAAGATVESTGRVSRSIYDAKGQRVYSVDALGYVVEYRYDRMGNLTQEVAYADSYAGQYGVSSDAATVASAAQAIGTQPSSARVKKYIYDTAGRLIETVDAANFRTVMVLDALGRATSVTEAYGTDDASTTTRIYDALGRIESETRAAGVTGQAVTTTHTYDALGRRLTSVLGGVTTKWDYDALGQLKKETQGFGAAEASARQFDYDAFGRLTEETDGMGRTTIRGYDKLGRLTQVDVPVADRIVNDAPDGYNYLTTRYAYSALGNVKTTDPAGGVSYSYRDKLDRVSLQIDAEGYATRTTYDAFGNVDKLTRYDNRIGVDPDINTAPTPTGTASITDFNYDALDRLEKTTDATNQSELYAYNGFGERISFTNKLRDINGMPTGVTTYTYDKRGLLLSETLPAFSSVVTGRLITTSYQYDGRGNRISKIEGSNLGSEARTTVYSYDKLDRLTKTELTDAVEVLSDGLKSDSLGVTQPLVIEQRAYDNRGNVIRVIDAAGVPTHFYYDALDRKTAELRANTQTGWNAYTGALSSWTYDKNGNVKSQRSYDGDVTVPTVAGGAYTMPASFRETRFDYDYVNRLTKRSMVGTGGGVISGAWTGTAYADETAALETVFTYDRLGNVVTETDPIGAITYSYYDKLSRKVAQVDRERYATFYTLDSNGNVVREQRTAYRVLPSNLSSNRIGYSDFQDGGTGWAIGADGAGVSKPGSPFTGTYLGKNYVKLEFAATAVDQVVSIATSFDNSFPVTAGERLSIQTGVEAQGPVRELKLAVWWFNAAGDSIPGIGSTDVAVLSGNPVNAGYDTKMSGFVTPPPGAVSARLELYATTSGSGQGSIVVVNPMVTTATDDQTTHPAYRNGAANLGGEDRVTLFTYDRNGRRLTETRLNTPYGYDVASVNGSSGQLAWSKGSATITYTYNALGQVLSKREANGDTSNYEYDAIGRLTKESATAFVDADGNTVRPSTSYEYNGRNELVRTVMGADGISSTDDRITYYTYDKAGRLTSVKDPTNFVRNYQYDAVGRRVREFYQRTTADGTILYEAVGYRYDAGGRLVAQAAGGRTDPAFNIAFGGNTRGITWMKYNSFDELVSRGMTATFTDSLDNFAGYQERFDYDAAGRLWRSRTDDGVSRILFYDKAGNQTLAMISPTVDLLAVVQSSAANSIRADGTSSVGGAVTTINQYDKRGMLVATREPDRLLVTGAATVDISRSRGYNAFGEVISETDGLGRTTNFEYNEMGRLVRKISPQVDVTGSNGVTTQARPVESYAYDISGRLVGVQDANGVWNTRLLLAGTGHEGGATGGDDAVVTREFHADGGIIQNKYDVYGNKLVTINELNIATEYAYDRMGRLTKLTHAARPANSIGNTTAQVIQLIDYYAYDGLGQRIKHWNSLLGAANAATTDYDVLGRVTQTIAMGGQMTRYAYFWENTIGITGTGVMGGWMKRTQNAVNLFMYERTNYFGWNKEKIDFGGHKDRYAYDLAGRVTWIGDEDLDRNSTSYTYFNTGQIAGQTGTTGTASYAYDKNGRRTKEELSKGGVTYRNATASYDALGRIKNWTEVGSAQTPRASINWSYDAVGNVRRTDATYRSLDGQGNASSTDVVQDYWYLYDSMNRVTTSQGALVNGAITRGSDGIGRDIEYNKAGQRVLMTYTKTSWDWGPIVTHTREDYRYTADGYLADVRQASDNAGTPSIPGSQIAVYQRDAMGRVTFYKEGTRYSQSTVYDTSSRIDTQTVITVRDDGTYQTVTDNAYDAAGNLTRSGNANSKDGDHTAVRDNLTLYTYQWWDGAVQSTITYDSDTYDNGNPAWKTEFTYDVNGYVQSASIYDGRAIAAGQWRNVSFVTDQNGMVVNRDEQDGTSAGDPRDIYYFFGGRQVGHVTNNGTDNVDYAASIAEHLAIPGYGPFANGATSPTPYAAFAENYEAINGSNANDIAFTYTASAGDTLQSIAQTIWGDASLWYMIAETNGLSGSEVLVAGQQIRIPDRVHNIHNNDSTFKPYNPNDAIGDNSPTDPAVPKKPKKNKCGVFGMILLAVVAIAVTAVTAGAALAAAAPGMTLGSGIAAVAGSAGALAGTFGSLGAIAVGAGAAVIGSVVSQGLGVAIGIQDKINWKGVAFAALSGGVGAAVGPGGLIGGEKGLFGIGPLAAAGRSVASGLLTQGVAVATGLQNGFDWGGLASAGISAGIGNWVGGGPVLSEVAGGLAGAAAESLVTGRDFGDTLIASLPGIIANTIGNLAADAMARRNRSGPDLRELTHEAGHSAGGGTQAETVAALAGGGQAAIGSGGGAGLQADSISLARDAEFLGFTELGRSGSAVGAWSEDSYVVTGKPMNWLQKAWFDLTHPANTNFYYPSEYHSPLLQSFYEVDRFAIQPDFPVRRENMFADGSTFTGARAEVNIYGRQRSSRAWGDAIGYASAGPVAALTGLISRARGESIEVTALRMQGGAAVDGLTGSLGTTMANARSYVPKPAWAPPLAAENVGPRTFTSSDPLVADLANEIEAAHPGHVVGVNVPVRNAAGQIVTDADIQLQNVIIQVKSGGGKGLTSQLLRTELATGMPTIGYGPTLKPSVVRSINQAGGLVTTDKGLLIEVVKP